MERLSRFVVRFRWAVLAGTVITIIAAGVWGSGVVSELSAGGFASVDAESSVAERYLANDFGSTSPQAVFLVRAPGSVDDPETVGAALDLVSELSEEEGVRQVVSYWTLGSPPSMRNNSGDAALVLASLEGNEDEVLDLSATLVDKYRGERDRLQIEVGGWGPLWAETTETSESDLVRAESIALPIVFVLLVIILGSVVAALLPLGIGIFSILGTTLVLRIVSSFTDVSVFALNLTTALGLGLAIDFALLIVSRFREELAGGFDTHDAVRRTVLTAGRTVLFSAGTVAVSLGALLMFPLMFLRSFGYAGMAVVGLTAAAAVIVLPALLAVLGTRVDRLRVRRIKPTVGESGTWHRLARFVMKRPIPIATLAVVVLLVLGSPFLGVRFGQPDDRVQPPGAPTRLVGDALRNEFDAFEASPIYVVVPEADSADPGGLAARVSQFANVQRVDGPSGTYLAGELVAPADMLSTRFRSDAGFYLSMIPSVDSISEEAEDLVEEIRAVDYPYEFLVAGDTAEIVDSTADVFSSLPWALGFIALVTLVVLFLMFGSLLVPAKAVVLNVLSLSAVFGALVWIFQDGNLSGFLNFTPTGSIALTMSVLIFCVAFGLSMDYEVFLLSRIKEEHDSGKDNVSSVASGLERTGRIVTAAALLMSVVFVAFVSSSVSSVKMVGVGLTVAVLVDAFIVRVTLVPAFMRLMGNANWWAPAPLRRVQERFGLSESHRIDEARLARNLEENEQPDERDFEVSTSRTESLDSAPGPKG